jgi:4-aminobutyrate aminotransferase / (S)-3-amino-2-methylpropionate transaminase / 5-aminovalerate transaminase
MSSQYPPQVRVPPPGPRSRELSARLAAVESPSVDARRKARTRATGADHAPIVYAEGEGVNVVDVDGNRYVDLVAGFGSLLLGHRPRRVARSIEQQEHRLWLALGDVCASEPKLAVCERLVKLYPEKGARVILGLSGADAITAAMKSAVLATGRPGIVAFEGSYHGLSHGPLAACGLREAYRQPFFQQLNPRVTFAPYPHDGSSLDAALTIVEDTLARGEVGAVFVEPVLGRGGCVVPPREFLPLLAAACSRAGTLLVCDEIWTGLGRSGAWLASLDAGTVPDLVCLGKGLGSGLPISACIGSESVMAPWGAHGGATIHTATHFGGPVACAAAVATLDAVEEAGLVDRARTVGATFLRDLRQQTSGHGVRDVRGRGLMLGLLLEGGAERALEVTRRLLVRGWIVLTGGAAGDVLTLTPPLDIDESLLTGFGAALVEALATT